MDKKYYFAFVLSIVALLGNTAAYFIPWQYYMSLEDVYHVEHGGYWAVCEKNFIDCQFSFNYFPSRGKLFIALLFILCKIFIFESICLSSIKLKIIYIA